MINSEFQTPNEELSMAIVTKLTSFTTVIKNSISKARKRQALSLIIK